MSNKLMGFSRCPVPVFTPPSNPVGTTVTVAAVFPASYIFYTKSLDGIYPTHNGISPTGTTIAIGDGVLSPNAIVTVATGYFLRAITYKKLFIDSAVTGSVDDGKGNPVGFYGPP